MKKNAMRRNLRQSIIKSFGRYIAIVMIIALGAGLFVGLLMTKSDMVATGQRFIDRQNMFDLRLMNSYGWTEEYLDDIAALPGIEQVEAVSYLDLIARVGDAETDSVYRFYTLPDTINLPALRGGRMPENNTEILVDGFHMDDSILGQTVTIQRNNDEDSLDSIHNRTFTIVGYIASPLYMDMNRGTTSVGSGSLSNYFYVREGVLELDYIPEIHVTIPGQYAIYSDRYNDVLDAKADELESLLLPLTERRLEEARAEAEDAYADGQEELEEGWQEYRDAKKEVHDELSEAEQELLDAEQEIADNEKLLTDGEEQIADARKLLDESKVTLEKSKKTLADSKASAYKQMSNAGMQLMERYQSIEKDQADLENKITENEAQQAQVNAEIVQVELNITQVDLEINQVQMLIDNIDISIDAVEQSLELMDTMDSITQSVPAVVDGESGGETAEEPTEPEGETPPDENQPGEDQPDEPDNSEREELERQLEELKATRAQYVEQRNQLQAERQEYNNQYQKLVARRTQLELEKAQLENNSQSLEDSKMEIMEGFIQLSVGQMQMENQLAAAEAQIESGEAQIEAGLAELKLREQEIADGKKKLEEGKQELADGWKEYEEGRLEADTELYDAWRKLKDGEADLAEARELIDSMTENDPIILDRRSNVGYNNLDSSSDIVQGVSRVFPVFFLLVASLVCITTMTRMIDEERTQIGTLKALGYSNGAIMSKYLMYSGTGAVIGCGMGVLVGSTVFPMILWEAYKIMLYISPAIVLTVNWWLCFAVVAVYTAVLLFVTWYCCRRTLKEVPAELIRPKSPDAGKALLVERLPFWNRISFLNKVTIRNIFRYRQRLAMMLVGIGGCTALLVTGFGLRDSIVNVVDFQFEDVTTYDMSVYFKEEVSSTDQLEFLEELEGQTKAVTFYHQSSVDLEFDGQMKELYMMAGDESVLEFLDLHSGQEVVELPGIHEVVVTVGVAEALGIEVGDSIQLRNADLKTLDLTVSGIYDNHVYNYTIVNPDTIRDQWGQAPEKQMAFVKVADGCQVHAVSAKITGMSNVMNVSVSEDLADMVGNMMEALDLVVVVIVFCAGLLAVIVLYNLTNININERIREIATIKVLGFNASETGAYVFKENMVLTVVGALFGLLLGKLLLLFVMTQIKIDMVWFKATVLSASYLWAIALTLLSAIVVDFIFYFKLQKINMAEALKSVE